MNTVFEFGAEHISNDILNNFLNLIQDIYNSEGNEFGELLITTYTKLYADHSNLPDISQKMIVWVLGEIGSIVYNDNQEKIHELISIFLQKITNEFEDPEQTRLWILTGIAKLSSADSFNMHEDVQLCFNYYQNSKYTCIAQYVQNLINLQQFRPALKQVYAEDIDFELSFLDEYVEACGGNTYDPHKANMNTIKEVKKTEIILQHREPNKILAAKGNKLEDVDILKKNPTLNPTWTAGGLNKDFGINTMYKDHGPKAISS